MVFDLLQNRYPLAIKGNQEIQLLLLIHQKMLNGQKVASLN